jgi:hypothetical protein
MTTSYQPIVIGANPNDGTGDNIRDAFDKVNNNFNTLYQYIFGVGGSTTGIRYIDLSDGPQSYTTGTVQSVNGVIVVTVNNAGNQITNRLLSNGRGIVIDGSNNGILSIQSAYTASITATAYTLVLRDGNGNISGSSGGGGGTASTASTLLLVDATAYETGSIYSNPNTIAARDSSSNISANQFNGTATSALASLFATNSVNSTNTNNLLLGGSYVASSTGTTANTIVGRDDLGQIRATNFIGNSFIGTLTGSATFATSSTNSLYANTATYATNFSSGVYSSGNAYPLLLNGAITSTASSYYYNAGTVYAVDFAATSDASLKDITGNIDNPLDKLARINGVSYFWNNKAKSQGIPSGQKRLGVLAQEVQKVAPEAVSENNGHLSVNYTQLIPILIEAIKELNKKIDSLSGVK